MKPMHPTAPRRGAAGGARAAVIALGLAMGACASPDDAVAPAPGPGPVESPIAPLPTVASAASIVAPTADTASASDDAARAAALAALADAPAVTLVEDWAAYGTAAEVEDAIDRNLGMGDNAMGVVLRPAGAAGLPPGPGLALTYTVGAAAPHDFVGFNRSFDAPADWSGATGVGLWLDGAAAAEVDVVFQFREGSGEVWRHQGAMPGAGDGTPLVLPFDPATFQWASWSTAANGQIDVAAVDQYGLYVGHRGAGRTGEVTVGPIVVLR